MKRAAVVAYVTVMSRDAIGAGRNNASEVSFKMAHWPRF
jgi:hypothetical protein